MAFSNPNSNDAFIRLDVLYEDNPYTHTIAVPIDLPFLKQEGTPLMVNVPTKEDILGDKITAFGPNSIGIPYFKGVRDCSLDIMKQLFDISRLFDVVDDFTDTYASFRKVADVELGYRGMEGQIDRYYEDVRQTAINISTRGDFRRKNSLDSKEESAVWNPICTSRATTSRMPLMILQRQPTSRPVSNAV